VIHLAVAPRAGRDLAALLSESEDHFGPLVAERYRRLVAAALRDLRQDHQRLGVLWRADLAPSVRLYHLRHSRQRLKPADRIARPRHVLVFRVGKEGLIVVRVLHDAMDFPRHLRGA